MHSKTRQDVRNYNVSTGGKMTKSSILHLIMFLVNAGKPAPASRAEYAEAG